MPDQLTDRVKMQDFSDAKISDFDFESSGGMQASLVIHKPTGQMCIVMYMNGTGSFKEAERRFIIPGIIEMVDPWNKGNII